MNLMLPSLTMLRRISSLALPMALCQIINVASGFFCMVMLSKLGSQVLAASAIIYATQLSAMVLGMSILFSLSVLIGHENGAGEFKRVGDYVRHGWLLSIVISIPIILFFLAIKKIELAIGQQATLIHLVQDYFQAYAWGVTPSLLCAINQQFGYAINQKGLMLINSIVSALVLLLCAYVFIFGRWGAPALGIKGLAYALDLQYLIYFLSTSFCFYLFPIFKKYHLFQLRFKLYLNYLRRIFVVGAPIFVQMGGEMLSLFATVTMVGWLGSTALAAYQIVNQFCFLVIIPIFAISQASGILVGQARGSGALADIRPLGVASLWIIVFFASCIGSLFLFAPQQLVRLYIDTSLASNQAILQLAISIFAVMAFAQLSDAIRNVYVGLLRGLFITIYPMLAGTASIWLVGMPISYVLGIYYHLGVIGLAMGGLIGMTVGAGLMAWRWQRCIRIDSLQKTV